MSEGDTLPRGTSIVESYCQGNMDDDPRYSETISDSDYDGHEIGLIKQDQAADDAANYAADWAAQDAAEERYQRRDKDSLTVSSSRKAEPNRTLPDNYDSLVSYPASRTSSQSSGRNPDNQRSRGNTPPQKG